VTRRVCLLGGESSGKTTLALALGRALSEPVVEEYGREL
jgi:HTH-type transcriptional repressor of NAD biosynthesis genes